MAVGPGRFQLYSKIDPVMSAGDYRFDAAQSLTGASESTPIETHRAHVTVRAPRFQLPPDQVLSTFPPAGSEGSYGSRLPQVVIKRRTLPWERDLTGEDSDTPWLALVLIAEGEATLEMNQSVDDCVTPGVTLPGTADVALGNYLEVRRSVVHDVFPTQADVPLLAHAREVDIDDTELMMGDDDGFLAVVISNRLPLPAEDDAGSELPVKYLACLVNLEGQFGELLAESPGNDGFTLLPTPLITLPMTVAEFDQSLMGAAPVAGPITGPAADFAGAAIADATGGAVDGAAAAGGIVAATVATSGTPPFAAENTWSLEDAEATATTIYAEMASDFTIDAVAQPIDPLLRFPVLLHWSFVSRGDTTFEELMRELDSGLIGTVPADVAEGRQPLEVVETGHLGLAHRTRRGDSIRSWYRGPLVPHPTAEPGDDRLALAHVSDQLRVVIPDGREDVSLATAFEIGRMLALSRPSIVAAMMRWRQTDFHVERRRAIWAGQAEFLSNVFGEPTVGALAAEIGVDLGRGLTRLVARSPEAFVGGPLPLVDPGRPIEFDDNPAVLVATGFGLDGATFDGTAADVLTALRATDLPGAELTVTLSATRIRDALQRNLDHDLVDLIAGTLDLQVPIVDGLDPVILGPTVPGTIVRPVQPGGTATPVEGGRSPADLPADLPVDSPVEPGEGPR